MLINCVIFFLIWLTVVNSSTIVPTGPIKHVSILTLSDISKTAKISLPYAIPAIDSAMEKLRTTYAGIFNWTHTYLYDRNITNFLEIPFYSEVMAAEWFYRRRPHADLTLFISPGLGEGPALNRQAAGWNSLMITSTGGYIIQANKTISPTWLATGPCLTSNYVYPYLYLMSQNNWRSVYLVVDVAVNTMPSTAEIITKAVRKIEHSQQNTFLIPVGGRKRQNYEMLLENFNSSSRVLFFFGHSDVLREILLQAAHLGMLTEDYVYIALEPFRASQFGNFSWQFYDKFDKIARDAYRSVLIISIAEYINEPGETFQKLIPEWKKRSALEYNVSFGPNELLDPNIVGTYISILLFAKVLNDTLTVDPFLDLKNGEGLSHLFFNNSFTIDDVPIYINELGQRRTDMEIKQFNWKNGSFQTFLVQSGATLNVKQIAHVSWYGGSRFPANEPFCGYLGLSKRCTPEETSVTVYSTVISVVIITLIVMALTIGAMWRNRLVDRLQIENWWKLAIDDFESSSFNLVVTTNSLRQYLL